MRLEHGLHLAYSTNVHPGDTWDETFGAIQQYTLALRERICPQQPFGIGLGLSNRAARELRDRPRLLEFQRWLGRHQCYVFTLNGFPFGRFQGARIKDQVYAPDWTLSDRLEYTSLLFDLLAALVPAGVEGSVSTLPCSSKEFRPHPDELKIIRANLWHCVEHVARVSEQTGRRLHLGLEPEPMCLLESSAETIHFFDRLRAEHPRDPRLEAHLGVNYDTCHFAVEFEEPQNAIGCLRQHHIKISKIHLGSALKVLPTPAARAALARFVNDPYLRQVVVCYTDGQRFLYRDLHDALVGEPEAESDPPASEWRIHFHVPLHHPAEPPFGNTQEHVLGVLDLLGAEPGFCSHLEMETDTWAVLPPELRSRPLVEQLAAEYQWTLARLAERGLFVPGPAPALSAVAPR